MTIQPIPIRSALVVMIACGPLFAQVRVTEEGRASNSGAASSTMGSSTAVTSFGGIGQGRTNLSGGTFGFNNSINQSTTLTGDLQAFSPTRDLNAYFAPANQFSTPARDPIGVTNPTLNTLNFSSFGSGGISYYDDPTGRLRFNQFEPTNLGAPNQGVFSTVPGNTLNTNLALPLGSNLTYTGRLGGSTTATGLPAAFTAYEDDIIAASPLFGTRSNSLGMTPRSTPGGGTGTVSGSALPRSRWGQILPNFGSTPQFGQTVSIWQVGAVPDRQLPPSAITSRGIFGGDRAAAFRPTAPRIESPQSATGVPTLAELIEAVQQAAITEEELAGEAAIPDPAAPGLGTAGQQPPPLPARSGPFDFSGNAAVPIFRPTGDTYRDMTEALGWIDALRARQEAFKSAAEQVPTLADSYQRAVSYVRDTSANPITTLTGEADDPAAQYARRAEDYLRDGQYYRALGSYEVAQSLNRANPLFELGQGHALIGAGEYLTAVTKITRSIGRFPDAAYFKLDLPGFIPDLELLDLRRAELETRLAQEEDYRYRFLLGYIEYHSGIEEFGVTNLERAAKSAPAGSVIARYPGLLHLEAPDLEVQPWQMPSYQPR